MTRRPRTQAVPLASAGERRRPRGPSPERTSPGCVSRLFLATGLVLIVIGMAKVVSEMPSEPTATPATEPLPITFGYALDLDTFLVTQPGNRFEHGDPFAYSVSPPVHPGVGQVYVAVTQFRAGQEVVLQAPSPQRLLPEPVIFGFETTTEDIIELFGYGHFTMKIYLDPAGSVYAQGRFEVVEPGVPRQ